MSCENANWIPIESNPEVINDYCKKLGLKSGAYFHDVFGLDEALLQMIPGKCMAFILLFPISETYENFRKEEHKSLDPENYKKPESLFFMQQTIGNACGTIGLIHALANNKEFCQFSEDSTLTNFLSTVEELCCPAAIAEKLASDTSFANAHQSAARQGANEYKGEQVDLHFVAIVAKEGKMFELDGRKVMPIEHGSFDEGKDDFKVKAAEVAKKFMDRDPNELRFTMLAMSDAPTVF